MLFKAVLLCYLLLQSYPITLLFYHMMFFLPTNAFLLTISFLL